MKLGFVFSLLIVVVLTNCTKDKNPIKLLDNESVEETYWEKITSFSSITIHRLYINPNDIIYTAGEDGIDKSINGGETWNNINSIGYVEVLGVNRKNIYTAGFWGQWGWIQYSTDDGVTWLSPDSLPINPFIRAFAFSSNNIVYTGSSESDESVGGIYYSKDNGSTWKSTGLGNSVSVWTMVRNSKDDLIAGTTEISDTVFFTGIHKSIDNGQSWRYISLPGLITNYIRCMYIDSLDNLYAGTSGGGLYISTDDGETWESKGLRGYSIYDITTNSENTIFASGYSRVNNEEKSIFYSIDHGETWSRFNKGLPESIIWCLAMDSQDYLYAGIERNGIFKTKSPTTEIENQVSK